LQYRTNPRDINPLHGNPATFRIVSIASAIWRVRGRDVAINRPLVVGILNVTPDSFSDGGRFVHFQAAIDRVGEMIAEGADIIDIGGESTRPQQARPVSEDEELARVIPVLEAVRQSFSVAVLSVDTTKSGVAGAAISAGADIINDVSSFRLDQRMGEVVAKSEAGTVLMHSRGGVAEMGTYTHATYREDVVGEIVGELRMAVAGATAAGVQRQAIVLDPGIGFAKRTEHSLQTLAGLGRVVALGYPVLVGVSRKRFVGELSHVEAAADRVHGTIGANVAALMQGARLFRVHDVAPNRQALDVAWGILEAASMTQPTGQQDSAAVDSRFPIPDSR
jgi:dihydropteroate synthase